MARYGIQLKVQTTPIVVEAEDTPQYEQVEPRHTTNYLVFKDKDGKTTAQFRSSDVAGWWRTEKPLTGIA